MGIDIDEITPRSRRTKHDYEAFFVGRLRRIFPFDDFKGKPGTVADSINRFARSKDIAAVALPVVNRDGDGYIEVWGDPSRTWNQGPPAEIIEKLKRGNFDYRKRRATSK